MVFVWFFWNFRGVFINLVYDICDNCLEMYCFIVIGYFFILKSMYLFELGNISKVFLEM